MADLHVYINGLIQFCVEYRTNCCKIGRKALAANKGGNLSCQSSLSLIFLVHCNGIKEIDNQTMARVFSFDQN